MEAPFELQGPALRVFQRAVMCLGKQGRDVALLFRQEELVLHGADDTHSAVMQFSCRGRFFRSAGSGSSEAVVGARALLLALRSAQQRSRQFDSMLIGLSSQRASEPRLVLELQSCGETQVRHQVPLIDESPFLPGEPTAGPHAAALSPGLLARVLEQCAPQRRCEEVTITAAGDGLRVQSVDLLAGNSDQANRIAILVQRSDLEACSLEGQGEATFSGRSLRDFARTVIAFTRDLEQAGLMDGSSLLELRFGDEGGSVVCRLASQVNGMVRPLSDFKAVLIIATRDKGGLEGRPPGSAPVPASPAQHPAAAATQTTPGRRQLPKQGAKRRAVPVDPEAFDAFPMHGSQATGMTQRTPGAPGFPTPRADFRGMPPQMLSSQQHFQRPMMMPGGAQQHNSFAASQPPHFPATGLAAPSQQLDFGCSSAAATHTVMPAAAAAPMAPRPPHTAPTQLLTPTPHHVSPPAALSAASPSFFRPMGPAPTQRLDGGASCGCGGAASGGVQCSTAPPPPTVVLQTQTQPAMPPRHAPTATATVTTQPTVGGSSAVLGSVSRPPAQALHVPDDSDDELIGADPDEVAFSECVPVTTMEKEAVDWFDVEACIW